MTRLEFLRRFTGAERVTLRTVAKTNPALEDYMALLDAAQDVDISDHDTISGVQFLEAAGLLAAGRAAEILSDPVPSAPPDPVAFVATHSAVLDGVPTTAHILADGTVRFANGKWSTLDTLAALNIALETL